MTSRMTPVWIKSLTSMLFGSTLAAAVAIGTASAEPRPALTVGVNSLGSKLDPADTPLATELRVFGSVYDTLIKRDYAAEAADPSRGAVLVPSLATAWKRLDARTVEVDIRHGVVFHNGDELTSDDVAFTFSPERIFGANAILPSAKKFFGCLEPVETLDRYKVKVKSCADDPTIELKLAHYAAEIVNKRAYLALGQNGFKRAPVGTGPMKFVEWRDGNYIKFAAHDAFFGGKPTFEIVTFREVPEAAARVAGLISGEFDIITQVSPDQFETIRSEKDLDVRPALLEQMQILWAVATTPAVSDKRVRQAMALAIDRDKIVSALWNGNTNAENQFQIAALGPLFDKTRKGFPYDPVRARALLAEASYAGAPINMRVIGHYYVNGETVMQAVQSMWQAVGINTQLEIVENWTQAFAPGAGAVMGGCGFEFAAPESLASCFFGEQALTRQRGFPGGIPGADALSSQLATTDIEIRKQTFRRILDVLEDEVPAFPLFRTPQFFAAKKSIRWQATPDFRMNFGPDNLSFNRAGN